MPNETAPGSDFSSPEAPSAEEIAAKHEEVFGAGSASVTGSDDPNWRENAAADKASADAEAYTDEELAELPREPEFTEDQKERFLESICSGKPFFETVSILGGKLKVKLRTRSTPESIEIVEKSSDEGEGNILVLFQMKLARLHLAYALVDIEQEDGVVHQYDVGDLKERLARVDAFPYPKYRILEEEMRKFDVLVDFFSEKAADSDFWQPVDGS